MAEITKPNMSDLWASAGAVIAPTSAKIKTGWTPEIPPHQWENFVQNRQDNAIAYLFQRGVPEWDSSTEYFNNKSLVMGSNGVLYKAVSNSVGVNPATDSGANWISLTANASEIVAGMIKIATTAQANAMTDDNVAITPAKLGGLLGTKSIIAGNGLSGGGALNTTRTLTLGTPSTLSGNTTNSVTTSSHTHALASASESIAGVVEIATAAEAQALTDDQSVITPKKLGDAFKGANQAASSAGYQRLPNGLLLQWIKTTVVIPSPLDSKNSVGVVFPIAFSELYQVLVTQGSGDQSESGEMAYGVFAESLTGASAMVTRVSGANASENEAVLINFFAIGR